MLSSEAKEHKSTCHGHRNDSELDPWMMEALPRVTWLAHLTGLSIDTDPLRDFWKR